jgi:hypothetical protein
MASEKPSRYAVVAVATLVLLLAIDCHAQEPSQNQPQQPLPHHSQEPPPQDHSCTVGAAASFAIPEGNDRQNFDKAGWGFQAGGGFAVTGQANPDRGWRWYVTSSFSYEKFKANAKALGITTSNPMNSQLAGTTSAHGGFSAVTVDLSPRYAFSRRNSLYFVGGFGWLRRGIGFKGVNPATLLQSNGSTLDRVASNSGVFDAGVGFNRGLTRNGGLMLFAEGRVYKGMAVNGGSTIVPVSVGVRW